jgi:hypothetical protein
MNQMQPVEPAKRREQRKGASIWTALTICLVLAVLGLAGLGYALYHSNSERVRIANALAAQQNETKRLELATQKAAEQGKLTNARNQQNQLLAQVGAATNSLLQLLAGSDQVQTEAAALGTNEAGRTVALHPELVRLAGRVFESGLPELPPEADITTRLEAVRRIEQQVLDARGTTYEPAPALGVTVQSANLWAEQGTLKVGQIRDALSGLVRESKVKFTRAPLTADSPTLAAAIAKQNEVVAGEQIRLADKTLSAAQTNAVLTRAEAGADVAKTQAQADAAALKTRAEAYDLKTRAEADQYAAEVRRKLAEDLAAKEREWQQHMADLELKAATNRVTVQNKLDEARKIELRKKASEPAIQTKLAPFTTPGYVGVSGPTAEKKPLSFQQLQASGALASTIAGQNKLVKIAIDAHDSVRPRWGLHATFYRRHDEQIQEVQATQKLLLELGPTLVEMGQLEP